MKLLERVSDVGAMMHLSSATVDCYSRWIREFLAFHRRDSGEWVHPRSA
jgi:hypothetical protein